jgi:hypothetical protein
MRETGSLSALWLAHAWWLRVLLFASLLLVLQVIAYQAAVAGNGALLLLFMVLWVPLTSVLFWRARVRRGVLLRAYLHRHAFWRDRLRGGVVMLLVQAVLAVPLAAVLLVVISQSMDGRIWRLLFIALPAWLAMEWLVKRHLAVQLNPRVLAYVAGSLVLYVLSAVLVMLWALLALHAEFVDLSPFSVVQAWQWGTSQAVGESSWLVTLAGWWGGVDGVRLWLVQQVAASDAGSFMTALAWLLALLQGALFIVPVLILFHGGAVVVDRLLTVMPTPLPRIGPAAIATVMVLSWSVWAANPFAWLRGDRVTIDVAQQRFTVPVSALDDILASNADWLAGQRQVLFVEMYGRAEQELGDIFEWARGRVPGYLDWHFSMSGNVSRTSMGLMAALSGDESAIAASIQEKLFPADQWNRQREHFDRQMQHAYTEGLQQLHQALFEDLATRMSPWRAHPHHRVEDAEVIRLNSGTVPLPDLMRTDVAMRQSAASLAVGGAAMLSLGHAMRRAATARATAQTSARVSARAGARAAGGASAVTAGTVCAPGGVTSLVCALGAFAVTTVTAEYLIVKTDEALHRARLEQDLLLALGRLEGETLAAFSDGMLVALKQDVASFHHHTLARIRPIDQISPPDRG